MKNKSRYFIFTIQNPLEKDLERFIKLAESLERHRYIVFGLENAPSTGTKHIQGYIQLKEAQRFTFLQGYFDFKNKDGTLNKFHIQIARGTPEENKNYASKEGKLYEFGEPSYQGKRTDLIEIKEAVKEDPRNISRIVDEKVTNHQQLRFAEGLARYYLPDRDPNTPPEVFWIFGPTGIGKTSLVYRNFDDICSVSSYEWLGTGYSQNEVFLMDDFREGNLSFETLLKITDRYPFMLFFKGSQIPLNSPFIIITSPHSINQTFKSTFENLKQLKRRVTQIDLGSIQDQDKIDLKNLDEKLIYRDEDDWNEGW